MKFIRQCSIYIIILIILIYCAELTPHQGFRNYWDGFIVFYAFYGLYILTIALILAALISLIQTFRKKEQGNKLKNYFYNLWKFWGIVSWILFVLALPFVGFTLME
jgi:nitrogen fixation/metabolism regulation signal transduction histidine kinase